MAVVSVNLSKAAGREWERIPRGKRSRVVSNYLVSRSLDAVDPTEGVSGHELAEMVSELRNKLDERQDVIIELARKVRSAQNHRYRMGDFSKVKGEEE